MADTKISALSSLTVATKDDVLPIVDDPAGTPSTKKISVDVLLQSNFWDQHIKKSADQDVTNNATLQDDTELQFSIGANEVWYVELLLLYAGNNTTGDYKWGFAFPSASGFQRYIGDNTTADAINVSTGVRFAAATTTTAVANGADASLTPRVMKIEMMLRTTASGTFKFQFANNTAAAGRTSRTIAGSILRARKLA